MDDRRPKTQLGGSALRDRRYAIRFPFASDAELIDLASGARIEGVTSDLSLGGCFVCTSRPFAVNGRTRITLKRKDETSGGLRAGAHRQAPHRHGHRVYRCRFGFERCPGPLDRSASAFPLKRWRFSLQKIGGARRNRTADKGFADLCLTTWRPRPRTESKCFYYAAVNTANRRALSKSPAQEKQKTHDLRSWASGKSSIQ